MSALTGPSEQGLCLCGSESDSVIRQASSALLPQVCKAIGEWRNPMSFVATRPQMLSAAASDLQAIGSALSARNTAAAAPTMS